MFTHSILLHFLYQVPIRPPYKFFKIEKVSQYFGWISPWIGKTLLLCHQLLVMFVQTLLDNHEPASPLPGFKGCFYWVVREVSHWFTPCVQLFFKNSFCMSSFYVVVYCRPLLPRQFFILHKTPLQKQSSSLCHHLVVEFVWWVVLPGQSNLKVSMDLLQNPFHDLKSSLVFDWCANFGLYFCVFKVCFP